MIVPSLKYIINSLQSLEWVLLLLEETAAYILTIRLGFGQKKKEQ